MSEFQIEAVLSYIRHIEPLTWIFQSATHGFLTLEYAALEIAG